MAKYRETENGNIFDNEKERTIPANESNRHYRDFLEWVALGNVADPYTTEVAATAAVIARIVERQQNENLKSFRYKAPRYSPNYQDIWNLNNRILGLENADPIPTFNASWPTIEVGGDGFSTVYEVLNCRQFRELADKLFQRQQDNYANEETHKAAVIALYIGGATLEEINDYDFSKNWGLAG